MVSKLYSSGLEVIPLISEHVKFMASVDVVGFQ